MRKKVIVFSQGCGSMGTYKDVPEGALTFCTPFAHGRNCGCGQIRKAASAGQKMIYQIINADALKEIK